MGGTARSLSYQYDLAGNRTAITYPDGVSIYAAYQAPGRFYYNYTSSWGLLVHQQYDGAGRPSVFYRWAQGTWGFYTALGYDAMSRPNAHQLAFMSGVNNIWSSYAYNPASQLTYRWSNTGAYALTIMSTSTALMRPTG